MPIEIDVPMYEVLGYPDDDRKTITSSHGIRLVLYGGYPGSGLNGGRPNGYADIQYPSELSAISEDDQILRREIQNLKKLFKEGITRANSEGMSVHVTFSNYFCLESELNDTNAELLYFMIDSSKNYGVGNGVIVANDRIEEWVRSIGRNELAIVCSCTKFYMPEGLLTETERLAAYHEAVRKYDGVVLTPPDSRAHSILSRLEPTDLDKMAAIINSPCTQDCNSYWHYAQVSSFNLITSAGKNHPQYRDLLEKHRCLSTPPCDQACHRKFSLDDLDGIVNLVSGNGVRKLKIGRGKDQARVLQRLLALVGNTAGKQI